MNNFNVNGILNSFIGNRGNSITKTEQNYIDTIKSGDVSKGEQLALSLCDSMGVSKDQAIAKARKFFNV